MNAERKKVRLKVHCIDGADETCVASITLYGDADEIAKQLRELFASDLVPTGPGTRKRGLEAILRAVQPADPEDLAAVEAARKPLRKDQRP